MASSWLPVSLDDIAIWVEALEAHVSRTVLPVDDLHAVRREADKQCPRVVGFSDSESEMEERRGVPGVLVDQQSQVEAVVVADDDDAVLGSRGRGGVEPEVCFVEAASPLLVSDRQREMRQMHGAQDESAGELPQDEPRRTLDEVADNIDDLYVALSRPRDRQGSAQLPQSV